MHPSTTQARLWLLEGVRIGLAVAMDLLGVGAPTEMWRDGVDDRADGEA
jgi:arginyl-tRNA synthetase